MMDDFKKMVEEQGVTSPQVLMKENNIVEQVQKATVVNKVATDENVRVKIEKSAERKINVELNTLEHKSIAENQEAVFNANKDACENYGMVKNNYPVWQVKMMKIGSGIMFIIYWIFATFTIVPISVFAKGLKVFFKNVFVTVLVAVLCYLLIFIGIPFLIKFLTEGGFL